MIEYVHLHRVRYREVDPMGIVYHTHYADYFEAARTEMLRQMGLAYKQIEEAGIIMPVVSLEINYHRPAYYDDLLEVVARVEDLPSMRVHIDNVVRRQGETNVLTSGRVTLCFVDRERNRPVRAPEKFLDLFDRALETHGDTSDRT